MHTLQSFRSKAKSWKQIAARYFRLYQTPSEKLLWQQIRARKLGVKFRRQVIMFGWIVDFCAPSISLIIELDGKYHQEETKKQNDIIRDQRLTRDGFKVLRIASSRVFTDMPGVLAEIKSHI